MAGENDNGGGGEQKDGQALNADARNIVMATSLLNSLGENDAASLMESPELKNLNEIVSKAIKNGGEDGSGADGEKGKGEEGAGKDKGKDGAGASAASLDEDSLFFGKGKDGEKVKVPEFKTVAEVQAFVEKTFKTKDLGELFSTVQTLQKAKDESETLSTQVKGFQKFFLDLPEPLFEALELAEQGKDWKTPLKTLDAKIDFNKPYENNNEMEIVQHYFPNITADEYSKRAENAVVQRAIEISKQSFTSDSKRVSADRDKITQNLETRNKAVKASVDTSLVSLQKKYPGLKEGEIQKIQKLMVSGEYKNLFLNPDGSFTDEAAANIAMAMFGETEIKKLLGKKITDKANKTVQDVIERGSEKPTGKESKGNPDQNGSPMGGVDKGIMQMMKGYTSQQSTYSARTN